jgi:hypothetical protein
MLSTNIPAIRQYFIDELNNERFTTDRTTYLLVINHQKLGNMQQTPMEKLILIMVILSIQISTIANMKRC